MFWNIYGKRVISTLRSKDTMIWTWIFPIVLATLFYATFTTLDTVGQLHEIPIGVIDNEAYRQDASFKSALESVSGDSGGRLFTLSVFSGTDEADASLEKGDIEGYIIVDGGPVLVVGGDGLNQTIAKSFLDTYIQTRNSAEMALSKDPASAGRLSELLENVEYTGEISLAQNPPTDKVNYFYALLAMICMYGGLQGFTTISALQANLSPLGARRTMSPVGRFRMVAYDLLGGITVHFACVLIVVAYIVFVLGVNFGSKLWLVLLTCFIGSILGVAFGAMISVTSRLKETAKVAVLVSVTMVCCFLSGLMVGGINYIVAEKAPAVAWLNPAARITDAFYCLYYYDTYERYFLNIGIILAMALAMFAVAAIFVRRQRYESI